MYYPLVSMYPDPEKLKAIRAKKKGSGEIREELDKLPMRRKHERKRLKANGGYTAHDTRLQASPGARTHLRNRPGLFSAWDERNTQIIMGNKPKRVRFYVRHPNGKAHK